MKRYVCHYEMRWGGHPFSLGGQGSKQFVLYVDAESDEDAANRITGIRESLVLDGELGGIIPADDGQIVCPRCRGDGYVSAPCFKLLRANPELADYVDGATDEWSSPTDSPKGTPCTE